MDFAEHIKNSQVVHKGGTGVHGLLHVCLEPEDREHL